MSKEIRLRLKAKKRQPTEDDMVTFILELQEIENSKRVAGAKAKRRAPKVLPSPSKDQDPFAAVAEALIQEVEEPGHSEEEDAA